MEDTKNKKFRAKFLAIAIAAALALSAAPALANDTVTPDTGVYPPSGSGTGSGTVGPGPDASGERSIAEGDGALGQDGTLLAQGAAATGAASIAIGGARYHIDGHVDGAQATGDWSVAIGAGSKATNIEATAVGTTAVASGMYASAFGHDAKALGDNSSAFGTGALAEGKSAVSIGYQSRANGANSTAVGNNATAQLDDAVALGDSSKVYAAGGTAIGTDATVQLNATDATALGKGAKANAENAVAIGASSEAAKENAIAIGNKARAQTENNIVIGNNAVTFGGKNGIALGDSSSVAARDSLALGANSEIGQRAVNSVALGTNSKVENDAINTVSVGNSKYTNADGTTGLYRRITNMAAGINDYDAVNVSQLKTYGGSVATILGSGVSYDATNNTLAVTGTPFAGSDNVAGGFNNLKNKIDTLGQSVAKLFTDGSYNADTGEVTGKNSTPTTTGGNIAFGGGSNIEVTSNTSEGTTTYTIKTVDDPTFTEVTIGDSTSDKSTTISQETDGSGLNMGGAVLSNLTDGTDDKDAATFGQLKDVKNTADTALTRAETAQNTADTALTRADTAQNTADTALTRADTAQNTADTALTRADTAQNTADTALTRADTAQNTADTALTRADTAQNTADTALTRADTALTRADTLKIDVDKHSQNFETLEKVLGSGYSNPNFSTLRVGNIYSDGTNINMGGGVITGLADGGVYQGSTDAVTGNQLWQAYKRMDSLQESINIVGAHAAALSGLHPIDYNPYEPTTLSAAIGTYRDEYAVAVGVFHYVRENVLFNLGASICSDGDVMGRAGISFTVGRGGDKKKALAPKDMNEVQAQLAEVRQALHELKAENAALKVRLDAKSK